MQKSIGNKFLWVKMANQKTNHALYDVNDYEEDILESDTIDVTSANDSRNNSSNDKKVAAASKSTSAMIAPPNRTAVVDMNNIPLGDYTLPDGRIMDAKNTLQSFAAAGAVSPITARIVATSSSTNAVIGTTSSGVAILFNDASREKVDARPAHITTGTNTGNISAISDSITGDTHNSGRTLHAQAIAITSISEEVEG